MCREYIRMAIAIRERSHDFKALLSIRKRALQTSTYSYKTLVRRFRLKKPSEKRAKIVVCGVY